MSKSSQNGVSPCFFLRQIGKNSGENPCEKGWIFRKRRFYPYIIIVTYTGYFFNVFSPDFSIFLIFSYAMYPRREKTPFWGVFEGKKDPFFVQMGWCGVDRDQNEE